MKRLSLFGSEIPFEQDRFYNDRMSKGQLDGLVVELKDTVRKFSRELTGEVARGFTADAVSSMGLRALARSRSAVYTSESLMLPLIELFVTRRRPRLPVDDLSFIKFARSSLNELIECDIARIERGVYPSEVLRPASFGAHIRRLPQLFREGVRASRRRVDKKARVFEGEAKERLRGLPEYYQRNFHFQGDGYLSDLSAELYEHQVEVLFGGAADAMRRLIIQPMKEKFGSGDGDGLTFLEVAAGTGRATHFVRLAFPKAKIVALDLSGPYLRRAQRQLAPFDRHDFIEANAEDLPFQDGKFDAVYSVFLFHELPQAVRSNVIRESARVLRRDGFFGFVDSLQLGDIPEFNESLAMFPVQYHEPFYKNYLNTPMAGLIEAEGLRIVTRGTGFLSKFIAAEKN
jgi:ubiquinone/menaquinone biosynthesis C-methylase UbiE